MKHRHLSKSDREYRRPYVERLRALTEREARADMQAALSTDSKEVSTDNA